MKPVFHTMDWVFLQKGIINKTSLKLISNSSKNAKISAKLQI